MPTRNWFDQLATGKSATVRELAVQNNVDENDVSRFLPLAFLSPEIVEIIIAGKQPPGVNGRETKTIEISPLVMGRTAPVAWVHPIIRATVW